MTSRPATASAAPAAVSAALRASPPTLAATEAVRGESPGTVTTPLLAPRAGGARLCAPAALAERWRNPDRRREGYANPLLGRRNLVAARPAPLPPRSPPPPPPA